MAYTQIHLSSYILVRSKMSDDVEPQMTELILKIIGSAAIIVCFCMVVASIVIHFVVKGLGG